MIVIGLIALLCVVALSAEDERFWPLSIFAVPAMSFHIIAPYLQDSYFIVAAALDWMVMIALYKLVKKGPLAIFLISMSFLSIIMNAAGNYAYLSYVNSIYYDCAYIVFYLIVLIFSRGEMSGISGKYRSDSVLSSANIVGTESNYRGMGQ